MKYSCDVVRDLIPLYIDDAASPASRQLVEEHISECAECQSLVARLTDGKLETVVANEREGVIAGQRRFFERKSALVGSVIAGVFMIPVLVCLIVNLASGGGMGWFFIVLSSLLVAASLSIVPLTAPRDKGLWTFLSFAFALVLLFAVCCICTGGRWFFVASSASLFGLSAVFLPFVVKSRPAAKRLGSRAGTFVMAADTCLFAIMMLAIGLHTKAPGFFPVAASISVPVVLLAWALFFIIRGSRRVRTKRDFLDRLEAKLSFLPGDEAQAHIARYGAEIDRMINAGMTEERAVGEMESADDIAFRLHAEARSGRTRERRRLGALEIALLAVGSPLWIALLAAAFAVAISLYAAAWAVLISLWAADVSFAAGCLGGAVTGLLYLVQGGGAEGVTLLCAACVLAGLSIILFFACRAATRGAAALSVKTVSWIKSKFAGRNSL